MNRPHFDIARGLLGLAVVAALAAAAPAQQDPNWIAPARKARKKNPLQPTPAVLEAGRKVYEQNCLACHGEKGHGDGPAAVALNPPPATLVSDVVLRQSDGALHWKIETGKAPMPAFGGALSDEQIWQVVLYVRSLAGPPPTAVDRLASAYGEWRDAVADGKPSPAKRKALETALGEWRMPKAPKTLDEEAKEAWRRRWTAHVAAVRKALAPAAEEDDPLARLDLVSQQLAAWFQDFPPPLTRPVLYLFDPEARNGQGGHWLARPAKVLPRPYGAGGEPQVLRRWDPRPADDGDATAN